MGGSTELEIMLGVAFVLGGWWLGIKLLRALGAI